tara:strand:+ start:114 stop:278 length:165 start_codon:yes stop_codon:yes gene_type:complete
LDLDDVDGFGPKIITIKELETGNFLCYVHQYSNEVLFKDSKARKKILDSPNYTR